MHINNQLLFAPDDTDFEETFSDSATAWKIAIIDDDILVHQVTKMVLEDLTIDGLPINFLSAFSAKDGYKLFQEHDDIAACILDVIMETDTAGIDLARDIREKLNNSLTRIVLRTGQPGSSLEGDLISKYNINDYKSKTELTSSKLRTLIISCIRTYIEIKNLKAAKDGMERIIRVCSKIMTNMDIGAFAKDILQQIPNIIHLKDCTETSSINATSYNGLVAYINNDSTNIVADISSQSICSEHDISIILPNKILDLISKTKNEFLSEMIDGDYIASLTREDGTKCIIFLKNIVPFDDVQQELISVYFQNTMESMTNRFVS